MLIELLTKNNLGLEVCVKFGSIKFVTSVTVLDSLDYKPNILSK